MNEIQKRLFKNLCLLKDILDSNEITYFLAYGTLLGAVRHQGFIPWDDDVDIYIKMQDLPRLRAIFTKESAALKLHDHVSHSNYPYSIPKVVDEDTILKEKAFEHLDYVCGIYIDIFPLIEIPDNIIWKFYLEKMRYVYYGLIKYYNTRQRRFLFLHSFIKRFINLESVHKRMEKNLLNKHRKGKYLTDPLAFERRLTYKSNIFEASSEAMFEGRLFKIPSEYKEYLNQTYGDYMQLPPENKRIRKHDFHFSIIQ